MDLHLNSTYLSGKNIIKVKRNFTDPYLWVLAQNNEVFRINSITKVIDDYTNKFSAFSNLQFIDIVGIGPDHVCIASGSSLLDYNSGSIKLAGAADGLIGAINSIGVTFRPIAFGSTGITGTAIQVATNKGLFIYRLDLQLFVFLGLNIEARIFEDTYRTEMYHYEDHQAGFGSDVSYYSTNIFSNNVAYAGYIWKDGLNIGHTIKSAYYTYGTYNNDYEFTIFSHQLWSTENGLFQNEWQQSHNSGSGFKHYLDGVNINKITSIYGLTSFENAGYDLTRENILIGSEQGLYFSNSKHEKYESEANYTFFHYDALGNKVINDICVNATSYTTPICEDGVWVAAADGLYLLKPDYTPYVDQSHRVTAIQFVDQDIAVANYELCNNTSIKALLGNNSYNGNLMQWYRNGQEIPNESTPTYTIDKPGEYYTIFYDPCSSLHFESNHLRVTQVAGPVFSFNYPDVLNYCDGSTATLKTNNKPAYYYRWYKDGILNGNTSATLNTTATGKYKVEVSACQGNWVASKEVQVNFIGIPAPVVTANRTIYCAGEEATLSANVPIDGSQIINWAPYQYRWYKDGVIINGSITSSINITQQGKYKCEVIGCSGVWMSSNEIPVNFINLQQPVITANKTAYCISDQATLSINFTNDGTYTINWLKDGNVLNADQNKTLITTNDAGSYTVEISNNITSCNSQPSTPYLLSFNPPPSLSLQQTVITTLCDGQSVDLQASISGGTIVWSTGQTTDKISVNQSGQYSAVVTTTAGCTDEKSINVQFFPNPLLSVPDATLCQFTNQFITLSAPTGFAKYEWNGQPGNSTFITSSLGKVSLTVTDNNGCTATQAITISSHCDDIHIPNTFTPNGDGVNDNWEINGLEGDPSVKVTVYNRNGTLLFQSKGYTIPWDGSYKGKALKPGVYYYVINAQLSKQVLSGPVTILK